MRPDFYTLTWTDILVSSSFIVISIILVKKWRLDLEKTLLIGTLRTFVQLTLMGYILTWFFQQKHWAFMVTLLIIMIFIASYEGWRRQQQEIPHFFLSMMVALMGSAIIVLGTILLFILEVEPWYSPYAAIPIGGMIIGNSLNSSSLTANRSKEAVYEAMKTSINSALIPNINGMMTVGIVQIPGVMTGQILAGIDPLVAVRYQIMIMYMWFTSSALSNVILLALVYRQYFTTEMQLRKELLRNIS
jgi:putative ABC transport system permease protein